MPQCDRCGDDIDVAYMLDGDNRNLCDACFHVVDDARAARGFEPPIAHEYPPTPAVEDDPWLTTVEAAERLGYRSAAGFRMAADRAGVPGHRRGRVRIWRRSEVDQVVERLERVEEAGHE